MTELSDMDKKNNEKNNMQNTKQDVKTDPVVSANNNNATPSSTTDKTKTTSITNIVRKLLKLDNKKETIPEKSIITKSGNGFMTKLMHFIMKTDSNVVAVASNAQEATQATDKHTPTDTHTKTTAQTDAHSLKATSGQKLDGNADIVLIQKPSNSQEQKDQQIKK